MIASASMKLGSLLAVAMAAFVMSNAGGADGETGNHFNVNVTKFDAAPGAGENGSIIRTEMSQANHILPIIAKAKTFRGWLETYHPEFYLSSSRLANSAIVEVKGAWDNSSKPLTAFGIPHTSISVHKLRSYDLSACRVLIIDCAGLLSRDCCQKVREFVIAGGALITTDWALQNTIEPTFPGYICWNGFRTRSEIVDAHWVGRDAVLSSGMVSSAGWCLEVDSKAIRILRPDAVSTLIVSSQLAKEEPDHAGVLAVRFKFGKGSVLHLNGHYGMNNIFLLSDPAPVIGISMRQALITNFVLSHCSP